MTLLLTVLTHEAIVQVADRRLTDPKTGQPVDDDTNKMVVADHTHTIAYTGSSRFGRPLTGTDEWLVQQLSTPFDGEVHDRLLERANAEAPRGRAWPFPHAFSGTFWWDHPSGIVVPAAFMVSNTHDFSGERVEATRDFRLLIRGLPPERRFNVYEAGCELTRGERRAVRAELAKVVDHRNPRALAGKAVEIARVAAQRDGRIGRGLSILTSGRELSGVKWERVPADPLDPWVEWSALFVTRGGRVIQGHGAISIEVGPIPPTDPA